MIGDPGRRLSLFFISLLAVAKYQVQTPRHTIEIKMIVEMRQVATQDRVKWAAHAKDQGWDVVRGMTSETNERARSVYDRYATRSNYSVSDLI